MPKFPILPEAAKPHQNVKLSPVANVMPRVFTRVSLFYKGKVDFLSVREALVRTLDIYPGLYGRLCLLPDASLKILPSSSGVPFLKEYKEDVSIAQFDQQEWLHGFTPENIEPCSAFPTVKDAVFQVKLTTALDGWILSVAFYHALTDAYGIFQFLNHWAIFCRGDILELSTDALDSSLLYSKDNLVSIGTNPNGYIYVEPQKIPCSTPSCVPSCRTQIVYFNAKSLALKNSKQGYRTWSSCRDNKPCSI